MIYICIATHNHARSVGLLLWKVRKVFHEFPREYHVLVADDASTDETQQTLENYQGALPMSVERMPEAKGYAATIEHLLRTAVDRTDRPKRDLAITLPADFRISPAAIPSLVRCFESGADLIVAESPDGTSSLPHRLVRRSAPWLLRPGFSVPGIRDFTSGMTGFRLVTLRSCLRNTNGSMLSTEGSCADAELLARAAAGARQVMAVSINEHRLATSHAPRESALTLAVRLYRAGRRLRIPAPTTAAKRI